MPIGTIAISNFAQNLQRDKAYTDNYGWSDFLKSKPWGDYDPLDSGFWTAKGQKSYLTNAAKNLLDPGDLFGIFGSGKKKKKDPKIAGKTQEEWVNTLGMDDEEYQNNLTELIRTISTGAAESRNKVSEINAMNDAPLATQLASERGVAIKSNEAAVEGQTRLTQIQENMNRQAEQIAMQMFATKESNDEAYARMLENQTTQSMGNLLNMLGQYLGEQYFGNNDIQLGNSNYYIDPNAPGSTNEPYQWY